MGYAKDAAQASGDDDEEAATEEEEEDGFAAHVESGAPENLGWVSGCCWEDGEETVQGAG